MDEEKNRKGKGDEIRRRKIYLFAQEKKDGGGVGGQYLEETIFFCGGDETGEGKVQYIFAEENKNGEGK